MPAVVASNSPLLIEISPAGCRTIATPTKPSAIAKYIDVWVFTLKKIAAKIGIKRGVVLDSNSTEVSDVRLKAVKMHTIARRAEDILIAK